MSHVKKGHLTRSGEWAKHLRPDGRRRYWRKHRIAEKKLIKKEVRRHGTR